MLREQEEEAIAGLRVLVRGWWRRRCGESGQGRSGDTWQAPFAPPKKNLVTASEVIVTFCLTTYNLSYPILCCYIFDKHFAFNHHSLPYSVSDTSQVRLHLSTFYNSTLFGLTN
jgi:hypothetical protein